MILLFVLMLLGGSVSLKAEEKNKWDFHEFEYWHKLLQYALSPSGEWAMWRVQSDKDVDTLWIRNIYSEKEYKFGSASAPAFSEDSRWVVFSEPGDEKSSGITYQVRLLQLETGKERVFKKTESFTFSRDSRFLFLKGRNANNSMELNLYDLMTERIKNVANIQEYVLDPHGKYMAYVQKTGSGYGNGIEVLDLSDLRILQLENDEAEYEKLKWTEHGLMFMKVLPDSIQQNRNREIHIIRHIGQKQQAFCFSSDEWADFPTGMKISEFYTPRWSKDGKNLFFGISQKKIPVAETSKADVDIWHWKDQEIQSRQRSRYYANRSCTYLCVWQPMEKRWKQIADSTLYEITEISTDGNYILAEDDRPYRPHYREAHRDIYVIQVATGKRVRLLENTILSVMFSKDGKYAFYFKDSNWWVYDLAKEKYINLTQDIPVELKNIYYDGPIDIPPSFGYAGWVKNDEAFWFYDEYDIWSVEPGTLKRKRLTQGREEKITFRRFGRGELKPDRKLLLKASGEDGKMGIYRFDPKGCHQRLIYGAFNLSRLEQSKDKKVFLWSQEDNITAPELFVSDEQFQNAQQLTQMNLEQSGNTFRKSELVYYKNTAGKELKGTLLYPVNYQTNRCYPMIVHIYEILSQRLNSFVFPSGQDAYNTMNYVLQEYFVFQPDITYEVNRPGESSVDCVAAAVREVLKRGDIDSTRLGLIGHSWGAYQTAYIITQVPFFKAAVAGAPLTDMVSMYNSIYWENGRSNQEMFETGQARFRQPWWRIPEQYIANSPVFQAEKIQTPLLMIFGTEDRAVDWRQGLELYITMRRLGKSCIMLAYQGEGHTIGGLENERDQTARILEYFNCYLKGATPAEWILNGRSYLKKKGEE